MQELDKDYASSFVKYSIVAVIILLALVLYLIYPYLLALLQLLFSNPSAILNTTLFKLLIFPGLIYVSIVA